MIAEKAVKTQQSSPSIWFFLLEKLRIQQVGKSHDKWNHHTDAFLEPQPSMIPQNVLCGFSNL
jgi:hypothetical protein